MELPSLHVRVAILANSFMLDEPLKSVVTQVFGCYGSLEDHSIVILYLPLALLDENVRVKSADSHLMETIQAID